MGTNVGSFERINSGAAQGRLAFKKLKANTTELSSTIILTLQRNVLNLTDRTNFQSFKTKTENSIQI